MPPRRHDTVRSLLARLPGRVAVQRQAAAYGREWETRNRALLASIEVGGPPPALWVALGDSLTQGVGAATFDQGWVNVAAERCRVREPDLQVLNLSVTGATTEHVLEVQLPRLLDLTSHGMKPRVVTVLVGANDMFHASRRAGLESRFAALVGQLPRGAIVAHLPQPVRTARRVNAVIDRAAVERGLATVDLRSAARLGQRAPDHFHPDERGHARIAALFLERTTL